MARRQPDRGQIILLAAFLLAVTFVALALVVNSAIFTENLATRDDVPGSNDALDHRSEVEANVGSVLAGVNSDEGLGESELDENIESMSVEGGLQQSTQGRLVNVTPEGSTDGLLIGQPSTVGNFTSADQNKHDWNLTSDDEFEVRNFQITVTDSEELSNAAPFSVVANDTADGDAEWRMEVARENNGDGVQISVTHEDHGPETCSRDDVGEDAVIDVTAGTVDGEPCLALSQLQDEDGTRMWFAEGLEEYRIEFENGNNIEGTYSFIGNDEMSTIGTHVDTIPQERDVLYSATVSYEFYTSAVGYETDIRVAPGEVPS